VDVPLTEGLGVGFGGRWCFINVLPADRAIEVANSESADFGWLKESNVDLNCAFRLRTRRQNVCCASASAATDEAPGALAPNVFVGSIGADTHCYCIQGVEGPERTKSPANRAIAARNRLGWVRQLDLDRAAVTGA
jgi:hypothetical protein